MTIDVPNAHCLIVTAMSSSPLLQLKQIVKDFPGVRAVDRVDLTVNEGEVLGLIGENGAGKSTLMKVLAGIYAPDEGELLWEGEPIRFDRVADSQRTGIELIHQELDLVPNLDITANLFLGRERQHFRSVDRAEKTRNSPDHEEPESEGGIWRLFLPFSSDHLQQPALELLRRVQSNLSPATLIRDLTTGQQQKIAIARALSRDSRLLIMDEPTASLTKEDSQNLFAIIRQLRRRGISIIYVSHRLEEILAITDRVAVMRDGRKVGELETARATAPQLIQMMVGRQIQDLFPHRSAPGQEVLLEVEEVKIRPDADPISFRLRRGEIMGFAGLIGAGRTDLMEALFGVRPPLSGGVRIQGHTFLPRHPRDSVSAKIAMVPEDRKQHGLVLRRPLRENLTLPFLKLLASRKILSLDQERSVVSDLIQKWQIRTSSSEQNVEFLSGGNQQKVVLAKWLFCDPEVLILDEPTRGIDVATKREIYHLITELARRGLGILLVSSEMEELLGICHRIVVLREGQLRGELCGSDMTEERVLTLATGGQ